MVWNGGKKRSNPILKRGDVEQKGEDVGVGVLTALSDNIGDASEWLNEEALKKETVEMPLHIGLPIQIGCRSFACESYRQSIMATSFWCGFSQNK